MSVFVFNTFESLTAAIEEHQHVNKIVFVKQTQTKGFGSEGDISSFPIIPVSSLCHDVFE